MVFSEHIILAFPPPRYSGPLLCDSLWQVFARVWAALLPQFYLTTASCRRKASNFDRFCFVLSIGFTWGIHSGLRNKRSGAGGVLLPELVCGRSSIVLNIMNTYCQPLRFNCILMYVFTPGIVLPAPIGKMALCWLEYSEGRLCQPRLTLL